ncbi:MAG: hypothetical protein Hyperionvirus2_160 [Hyperionvirus sp.]|uniref:Uncharacterized protein n=1 Tax=Hyperionvirus sp. TaxID=2487770 RepID=A0A3G5A6Y3_9VIRU|nr:MAG: hypothetical protein Hyperionvirus2_160 [Hyperionvirus sp.]
MGFDEMHSESDVDVVIVLVEIDDEAVVEDIVVAACESIWFEAVNEVAIVEADFVEERFIGVVEFDAETFFFMDDFVFCNFGIKSCWFHGGEIRVVG